ncbi:MAG: DsbA family protein, partial [Sphingopyxis sp.]
PAEIAALMTAAGVAECSGLAERMDSEEMAAMLDAANAATAERGVFGSPTFFVGDEMFFGNDRLEFMREALAVTA